MGMILNGEMRRIANHKMTVSVIRQWFCVNILQSSESDQSFSVFTITSTFLTSCHLAFTVFGYFWIVMSTRYQRHIRIRAMCGSYLLKCVDKGMVTLLFVFLMFRALQLLYIVYSRQRCFFVLLERSSRLNVTFVLTLYIERKS